MRGNELCKFIKDIFSFIFCLNLEVIPFSTKGKRMCKSKNFFLISLILLISIICFYFDFQNIINFFTQSLLLKTLTILILYLLFRIYWSWIKSVWWFLQKDGIIRYLFHIIIPIAIIVISYQYWFYVPNISDHHWFHYWFYALNLSLNSQSITIGQLNGFYSALFTAIAVLVAIASLSAWNTIKKLKEIEDKVNFLHEKKELAKRVRELFENNDENDISSRELKLSADDKKKLNKTKEYMINEITDDSWLEIVLAKQFIDKAQKEFLHKEKTKYLAKALKVFEFIENRDLLDENSNIDAVLYHFLGQVYQEMYKSDKELKEDDPANLKNLLSNSMKYYKKSLNFDERRDETHGNLAVVLIELAKLNDKDIDYLKEAINHLDDVIIKLNKATYNTYYDLARAKYLNNKNNEEVKRCLFEAADKINSTQQKERFVDYIKKDGELKNMEHWEDIINKIKERIDKKQWLQ
jgi:hypothetical protein